MCLFLKLNMYFILSIPHCHRHIIWTHFPWTQFWVTLFAFKYGVNNILFIFTIKQCVLLIFFISLILFFTHLTNCTLSYLTAFDQQFQPERDELCNKKGMYDTLKFQHYWKGQMIVPDWNKRILDYTRKYVKTVFFNENSMKIWSNIV